MNRPARRFPGKGLDTGKFSLSRARWLARAARRPVCRRPTQSPLIDFSREFLPQLRAELGLAESPPRGLGAEPLLDEPRRRRALLQRACLMARCALWEEASGRLRSGSRRHHAGRIARRGGDRGSSVSPVAGDLHPARPGHRGVRGGPDRGSPIGPVRGKISPATTRTPASSQP